MSSCNEASEAIDNAGAAADQGQQTLTIAESGELQDGDSNSRELEPGELLTPPHQQQQQQQPPPLPLPLQQAQGIASPVLKKMLTKDVKSKALRKLNQIDTENGEEKVQAMLELEAIRRKAAAAAPLENGNVSATASPKTTTAKDAEADDSEGLYSDTDSSTDEQKRVEDVQQARKEKQAEAAAAAAVPPQVPAPHHPFMNPMRFHLPPRMPYMSPMGFMHRMPRGGMRGMRPPFNRPPGQMRCATPRGPAPPFVSAPSSTCNGPQGTVKNSADAYGPALPPGQGQGQPKQSELR